jgi:hypothetical protein
VLRQRERPNALLSEQLSKVRTGMKRSFLDLLILLAATAAIEAFLSGMRGPMTLAAGLALPVVLSSPFEALIVLGAFVATFAVAG